MMIARPLVAGPIAGAMLGDVWTGLSLGVLFELFQYEVMPVGAVRYPEYGPATVVAVSAAHAAAGTLGLGLGALVGLISGTAGGMSLHAVRRLNARAVRRATPALEAGDAHVLVRLHTAAIVRDAVRAALVTALGLGLALLARTYLAGTISVRRGAGGAFLQCGSVSVRARGGRRSPGGARGRAARAGRAAAHRVVWPAGLPGRPAGVGGLAAVHLGAGPRRRGARAWAFGHPRLPGALQRRSGGAALVGAAGGVDARHARGRGTAPAAAAAGDSGLGTGHGVRGGRGAAARGAVPEQRIRGLVARGARRRGGGRGPAAPALPRPGSRGRPPAGPCTPRHARGVVMAVIEREAKIVNPLGMHARPAAEFVKLASRFKSAVEVKKDDLTVNGKSIMGVMMLAAECGSSLIIRTDGD